MTNENPTQELETSLSDKMQENLFEIQLEDETLIDNNRFFIIFESQNPNFMISILKENEDQNSRSNIIMDLVSPTGNILFAMSDTYYRGHLSYFKKTKKLLFYVTCQENFNLDFTIKIQIQQQAELQANRSYYSRIDKTIQNFQVLLSYKATLNQYRKIRFQVIAYKYDDTFSLDVNVTDPYGAVYIMNNVYKNIIGGILSTPKFNICNQKNCGYTLKIQPAGVKIIIIESFLVEGTEILRSDHHGKYYDRTYKEKETVFYQIPFMQQNSNMDMSITLIPVTQGANLYANAQTQFQDLEKYYWKEKGNLSKRITITQTELQQMHADESDIYIAVYSEKQGEFLIHVEMHDSGTKGRLNDGFIESGFVKSEQINNYYSIFQVFKTQNISFNIQLNIISGDANLYVKQCDSLSNCQFKDKSEFAKEKVWKIENENLSKNIDHEFECKQNSSQSQKLCIFAIAVFGKENHGTHYDISLQQNKFHRLMTPGQSFMLNLIPEEIKYLKFSFPARSKNYLSLQLIIENIWGNFNVYVDRTNQYPDEESHKLKHSFYSSKSGLFNSYKTILINQETFNQRLEGVYYIGVKALTSCQLKLKFFEKSVNETMIHSLNAGHQARGQINNYKDISYYNINASLSETQSNSVQISITPLKGKYVLYASKNGKLPTNTINDIYSTNNNLELSYDENNLNQEYIIGVQLQERYKDQDGDFQFMISFAYSNKAMKLNPGIISIFTIKEKNIFSIEISPDMSELLILKGIFDGHSINLCAKTSLNESSDCVKSANERSVSVYFDSKELDKIRSDFKSGQNINDSFSPQQNKVELFLMVKAAKDQKYSIGYTYNDHPFKLIPGTVVHGPTILRGDRKINFIFHAEKNSPVNIYFNSKGNNMNIYTQAVQQQDFDDKIAIQFPTQSPHDEDSRRVNGYSTNISYSSSKIEAFGDSPEILISIRPDLTSNNENNEIFDHKRAFVLQCIKDSIELQRTEILSQYVNENQWTYYHFYNNGKSKKMNIYVNSNSATVLRVVLVKNLQQRPPFDVTPLIDVTKVNKVELFFDEDTFKENTYEDKNFILGYYTLGVKTLSDSIINLYWNNNSQLDYIELTPNHPSTISLKNDRKIFFSFFAREENQTGQQKGSIRIHFEVSTRANIYIINNKENDLIIPSENDYNWKSNVGPKGGVTVVEIKPNDPNYCVECTYIGTVETVENGDLKLIANVEHSNMPIYLTTGLNYFDVLQSGKGRLFRVYNPDDDLISLSFNYLSGFVEIYISDERKVDEQNYRKSYVSDDGYQRYQYIKIFPSEFDVKSAHDYYVYVVNKKKESAAFSLDVIKNSIKTPIKPGVRKFLSLGPQESTELFYINEGGQESFDVELEIVKIHDNKYLQDILTKMPEMLDVYFMSNEDSKFTMPLQVLSQNKNRIYYSLDISSQIQLKNSQVMTLSVFNPIQTTIKLNIDLIAGNFKLINMNEYNFDYLNETGTQIYEAQGHVGEDLFVDIRMCSGETQVSFYESDYDKIEKNKFSNYKTIKDSHSSIHYLKLKHEKVFIKVFNSNKDNKAVYNLNVFTEKQLNDNSYTEMQQMNHGKIVIETEKAILEFDPIKINSKYPENYIYKFIYTSYISSELSLMKYAKNCEMYMTQLLNEDQTIHRFDKIITFKSLQEMKDSSMDKITIKLNDLAGSKKYYGIVVVKVEIYSSEKYLKPIATQRAYYDEFIFITPKLNFSFNTMVAIVVVLGFLISLYFIVNSYVFGDINKFQGLQKLSDMKRIEDSVIGFNAMSILEQEYYEIKNEEEQQTQPSIQVELEDQQDNHEHDFELTDNDKNTPLDLAL